MASFLPGLSSRLQYGFERCLENDAEEPVVATNLPTYADLRRVDWAKVFLLATESGSVHGIARGLQFLTKRQYLRSWELRAEQSEAENRGRIGPIAPFRTAWPYQLLVDGRPQPLAFSRAFLPPFDAVTSPTAFKRKFKIQPGRSYRAWLGYAVSRQVRVSHVLKYAGADFTPEERLLLLAVACKYGDFDELDFVLREPGLSLALHGATAAGNAAEEYALALRKLLQDALFRSSCHLPSVVAWQQLPPQFRPVDTEAMLQYEAMRLRLKLIEQLESCREEYLLEDLLISLRPRFMRFVTPYSPLYFRLLNYLLTKPPKQAFSSQLWVRLISECPQLAVDVLSARPEQLGPRYSVFWSCFAESLPELDMRNVQLFFLSAVGQAQLQKHECLDAAVRFLPTAVVCSLCRTAAAHPGILAEYGREPHFDAAKVSAATLSVLADAEMADRVPRLTPSIWQRVASLSSLQSGQELLANRPRVQLSVPSPVDTGNRARWSLQLKNTEEK